MTGAAYTSRSAELPHGHLAGAAERRPRRRAGTDRPLSWKALTGLVISSRLLVLAAGAMGAVSLHAAASWHGFDPARISTGFGQVGNPLAGAAVRWDSIWYLGIAGHGYSSVASTSFFPVYPLLTRVVSFATGSTAVAGLLISWASFAVALVLLWRLTELELGPRAARATIVLLAVAPLSFFFTAVYTESLFLALALGTVYAARRDRWALAGVVGTLAAATRITGVLLVVMVLLPQAGAQARARIPAAWRERRRIWLCLTPTGLVGYLAFLAATGYGPLAPFRGEASGQYGRHFVGPLAALWQATSAAIHAAAGILQGSQPLLRLHSLAAPFAPGAESIYLLLILLVAIGALVLCFRRLPAAYGIFALLALLVSISSPVAAQPLKSFDRYALTIFPLWMVAGAWLSERRLLAPAVTISVALLVFFTVQFASWTFVA